MSKFVKKCSRRNVKHLMPQPNVKLLTLNKMEYRSCNRWKRHKQNRIPGHLSSSRSNRTVARAVIHLIKRPKMLTRRLVRISQTGNFKVKRCEQLWDKLKVFKLTANMTKLLYRKRSSKMIMLDVIIVVVDSTKKLQKDTLLFAKRNQKKIKSNMGKTTRLKRVAAL